MATYDLLMLAILVGLTLYGYFKGMAWQVAFIASFVASYYLAVNFADQLAPRVTFVNPPANKFAAMALIYAGASLGVWMLFRIVRGAIDSVKMEGFDHQMGAILGFGRGVLWCVGVTFFAVTLLPSAQKQQIVNSKSGYYIARLLNETESLVPSEVHQVVGPYLDRLGNELNAGQQHPQPAATQAAPGWPSASSPAPAQPVAPAWGQPAETNNAPGWPSSSGANGWPQAAAPAAPAQPAASDFGWPDSGDSSGATPSGPQAAPVSWPKWD